MNFCLKIDNTMINNNISVSNDINSINTNISLKKININHNIIFKEYNKIVSSEKTKIDELENCENWDKMKKIGNPYELVYTTYNKKRKNDSISQYIPISRSYFKMWEIYYKFNIFKYFNKYDSHIYGHLAEGPGGFMEASYNYKCKITNKNQVNTSINDIFYGITLKPTNDYIPDFSKLKKMSNGNIRIEYGNLYILNDVKKFINKFNSNKAHIVTADGGFDYSRNFNGQEINSCQIIYSECVIALNILKSKGCFVCKVFDIFSLSMLQIVYLLTICFEEVHIYKPETSRPANSEKYLVCLYYKDNLTSVMKNNLLNVIEKWNIISNTLSETESVIFNNFKISKEFIHKIDEYNKKYIDMQIYYLNKTIELAKSKIEKEQYYNIIHDQVINAINWCKKYDIPINKNSIYYIKNMDMNIG
jgi:cap1 methyltransferase